MHYDWTLTDREMRKHSVMKILIIWVFIMIKLEAKLTLYMSVNK